ncbi:MAG: methyl-accepting chemotaxis protein [Pseudomonadota bacterium]|nr:methyl-accepting chemotaxis protein [Pseudomonadota bacterium]
MTIGKKIASGIASVLFLMTIIAIWSILGISGIVDNAAEVIYGNQLRGEIAQKEVDHLNWANKVTELLTDDLVTTLDVQTDPAQCAFGKWLLSDARREAEKKIPELKAIFAKIDAPHRRLHESAADISKVFNQADLALPGFLVAIERDHLAWLGKIYDMMLNNREIIELITDPRQCAFGKFLYSDKAKKLAQSDSKMARMIDEIIPPHAKLHESAKGILEAWAVRHPGLRNLLRARLDDHRVWGEHVASAIIGRKKSLQVEIDSSKCALGLFLSSPQASQYAQTFPAFASFITKIATPHKTLHRTAIFIKDALKKGDFAKAGKIYNEQTIPALNQCETLITNIIAAETVICNQQQAAFKIFNEETLPAIHKAQEIIKIMQDRAKKMVEGFQQANQIFAETTKPSLAQTRKFLHQITTAVGSNVMTDEVMLAAAQKTKMAVIILSVIAAIIGIFLAYFISNGIAKSLTRVIDALAEGSHQVAAAAGQVSSASQSLAEGSSEQAASLEETSSSVEELASMTKQNADNSDQADRLTKDTVGAIGKASTSITTLSNATEEIYTASQETQKIIKSIDEIAFQTNLLALNAAVEAARAGEAGAGFAVVADEVRNLAARSAEAAKSTAELIGSTVDKVSASREVAAESLTVVSEVIEKSGKVGELIGEVTAASQEQSNGVGQINIAISEMDKVTQQNAANAEESAAAAEELNAQAEQMNEFVGDLTAMVTGKRSSGTTTMTHRPTRQLAAPKAQSKAKKDTSPAAAVIPFDDDESSDDFEGF